MQNPETNPISLFFKAVSHHYGGLVAVILVISACVLWLTGKEVPGALENLTFMVVSFLFGQGVARRQDHLATSPVERHEQEKT